MKRSTWLIMILPLFLVGSMGPVGQTSAAEKTTITGTDTFDPYGLLGPAVGEIINPATITCPGYEPTEDPMLPCPAGSRINTRGFTIKTRMVADSELITGWATIVINANFDAFYTGPAWGTIRIDLDAGGTWEGNWEGIRVFDVDHWVIPVHASGHGTAGLVDGMIFKNVDVIVSPFEVVIAYFGNLQGTIIDPHSK
jgi:hypothetical protein